MQRAGNYRFVSGQTQFLYMTSTGWKTGHPHKIEIWFVEYTNRYYIISEAGASAHWAQNIAHNPQVSFSVNGETFEGAARKVDAKKEPELSAIVSKLMSAKYGWSDGLIVEISPK
jgi:deazaflavin-dependent oxidoreductase (nitroreductase family)